MSRVCALRADRAAGDRGHSEEYGKFRSTAVAPSHAGRQQSRRRQFWKTNAIVSVLLSLRLLSTARSVVGCRIRREFFLPLSERG